MDELLEMLHIVCTPLNDRKEFIKTYCCVEFEPHGQASESWEVICKLELPQIRYHWKNNKAEWVLGAEGLCMIFEGRTFKEVIAKAKVFLREYGNGNIQRQNG